MENNYNNRQDIYDRMCYVLTQYEETEMTEEDLYDMLVDIQNNYWDMIVYAEN